MNASARSTVIFVALLLTLAQFVLAQVAPPSEHDYFVVLDGKDGRFTKVVRADDERSALIESQKGARGAKPIAASRLDDGSDPGEEFVVPPLRPDATELASAAYVHSVVRSHLRDKEDQAAEREAENEVKRANMGRVVLAAPVPTQSAVGGWIFPSQAEKSLQVENAKIALADVRSRRLANRRDFRLDVEGFRERIQLNLQTLSKGDCGRLPYQLKVKQVVDEDTALAEWRKSEEWIWVAGIDTSEMTDSSKVILHQLFVARGTRTYQTALGGSKTVWEFSPFGDDDFEPHLARRKVNVTTPPTRE